MKSKNVFSLIVFIASFVFILSSCGGKSEVKSQTPQKEKIPDWVVKPPKEPGYVFFTGYGEGLDLNEAKQMALNEAKQHIVEYINSEVTAVFKMEGFATEEGSFADVVNKVVSKGTANIQMPPPEDVYLEKSSDEGVEVYKVWVLVKYPKSAAEKERRRIEDEIRKQLLSVDEFIDKGDKALAEGRVLDAVNNYLRAALNSLNVPKRKGEYPTIVGKAKDILKKIQMVKVSGDNQKGTLESGLKKPLVVKLFYKSSRGKIPVVNATVSFKMKKITGDYNRKDTTDSKGIARCQVSKVDKPSSRIKLKAYLDLDVSEFMSHKGQPYIDGVKLKEIASKISVEFTFSAKSSKAGALVGVAVVEDRGNKGIWKPSPKIASKVQKILSEFGYKLTSVSFSANSDNFDSKVQNAVNKVKSRGGKYLVVVSVSYDEPEMKNVGGMKRYKVKGEVSFKIVDVVSGDTVSSDSFSMLRYGTSKRNAVENFLKTVSDKLSESLSL